MNAAQTSAIVKRLKDDLYRTEKELARLNTLIAHLRATADYLESRGEPEDNDAVLDA